MRGPVRVAAVIAAVKLGIAGVLAVTSGFVGALSPIGADTAVVHAVMSGETTYTTSTSSTTSSSSFAAPSASVSGSSVTWSWTSPGAGTTRIYIGTSAGGTSIENGTDVGSGTTSYTKTDLSPGSYYAYVKVVSTSTQTTTTTTTGSGGTVINTNTNTNTNTATSGNSAAATVADTTPPTFSGLSASASGTSITVTWTTNEAATSKLNGGSGASLPAEDTNRTTSHSMTVSGLTAGQTYSFTAQGTDAAGNTGTSSSVSATVPAASSSDSGSVTTQSTTTSSSSAATTTGTTSSTAATTSSKPATTAAASDTTSSATPTSSEAPTTDQPTVTESAVVAAAATSVPGPTPWQQFALAYSLIGLVLAVLASLLHWGLPYLANQPTAGATEAIGRRVHAIQAAARGFGWLEYPLVALGSVVEGTLLVGQLDDVAKHTVYAALYAALWCLQILFWLKRPLVGKVSTPRQQPVSLAVVRLFHAGTNKIYATLATERDGRFGFQVHTGSYDLKAEKAGYSSTTATEAVGPKDSLRANLVLTPGSPEPTMTKPNPTGNVFWDSAPKTPPELVK